VYLASKIWVAMRTQAPIGGGRLDAYTLYLTISAVAPFLSLHSRTKLAAKLYWQLTDTITGDKITDCNRPWQAYHALYS